MRRWCALVYASCDPFRFVFFYAIFAALTPNPWFLAGILHLVALLFHWGYNFLIFYYLQRYHRLRCQQLRYSTRMVFHVTRPALAGPVAIYGFEDKSLTATEKLTRFMPYWTRWQTLFQDTPVCTVAEWYADQPVVDQLLRVPLRRDFLQQCLHHEIPFRRVAPGRRDFFPWGGMFGYSVLVQLDFDGAVLACDWS